MLGSGAKPMASNYGQARIFMDIAGKLRFRPAAQCDEGGLKGCWNRGYTNGKGSTAQYTGGEEREGDGISCLMPSPSASGGYALARPPSAGAAARGRRITAESVSLGASSSGSVQQQKQQRTEPSPSPMSAAASEGAVCSREATTRQGQPTIPTPQQNHTDSVSSSPLMSAEAARDPKQVNTSSSPSGVSEKKSQLSDQLLDEMFGAPSVQYPPRNSKNINNTSAPMPAPSGGSSYVSHVDPALDTLRGPQPATTATTANAATDFDPFASPPKRGYPINNAPALAAQSNAALPVLDHTVKVSGGATQHQWGQAPQQQRQQQQHVNSIDDIFS